jgi:hypothetical protein
MRIGFVTATGVVLASLLWAACSGAAKEHENTALMHEDDQATASNQPAPAGVVMSKQASEAAVITAAQAARQSFLTDGRPSVDTLMDEFIQALTKKDKDALTKLRVSKTEYVDLIVPGTVPVGQPPRMVSEQPKEYYWNLLDTKSHYYADNLVGQFGGRSYRSHQLKFSRPTMEYAWYRAVGQVRLELEGEDDKTYHLLTGWLAEVDGKYKFISYEYND